MKKLYFFLFSLSIFQSVSSQNLIVLEDFEGTSNIFTSTSASGTATPWALSSNFAHGGSYSDSNAVQLDDTLYLTSASFSTVGYSYVILEFHHIAKIHLFDNALVELSDDNGLSWTELTSSDYFGSAFLRSNKYFSSISYPIWDPANFTSTPQNSWWQKEEFNISAAGNLPNVKIRFVLIDTDNNGARGSYGWLLDDVSIKAATCELIPPSISISGNALSGNVHAKGPYRISAEVQDASGISSVQLTYTIDGGAANYLNMTNSSGNIFEAFIPSMNYGDTVCYSITAIDNSQCLNIANEPVTGCTEFYVVQGAPAFCTGTVETSYPYTENFDQFTVGNSIFNPGIMLHNWKSSNTANNLWIVHSGFTSSTSTGPDFDHTSGFGNYLYIEASGYSNSIAILESPCFDLSGYGNKKMGFWYHMYGVDMGELHVDIETTSGLVQDVVPAITGNQGNTWNYLEVDLSSFSGSIAKVKIRGIVGNNYHSDIAVDDFKIYEEPADVGILSMVSPSASGCNGGTTEYVTVQIANFGTKAVDSVPVAYRVNNGNIVRDTAFLHIPTNSNALFSFQQTVNLGNLPSYSFDVWTELDIDLSKNNDSVNNVVINTAQFPLMPDTQNFELFTVGTPGVFVDGWTNNPTNSNSWFVNSGSTPTASTGPSGDTSSSSGNGNYLYFDAAAANGQFASLMSPCLDLGNMVKPKMKFYYHMYGADMGILHLDVRMNGMYFYDIMPPISGDQGNNWNEMTVDLSQFSNISKLVFRAEKGNGIHGDIAIDKVIFFEDPVGLPEVADQSKLVEFYPNPSDGQLSLRLKKSDINGIMSIMDIAGKIVMERTLKTENNHVDLEHLKAGVYFISYRKGESSSMEKLILY